MASVRSADGTWIHYQSTGASDLPAVVMIQGALNDALTLLPFVGLLADQFEIITYDRRGRGASADIATPYRVESELEDLAAVLDSVGRPAYVFANCSGAAIALRAAASGYPIQGLVLYEPPYFLAEHRSLKADYRSRLRDAIAEDRREDALRQFMLEAVQLPEAHFEAVKQSELWPSLMGMAPTLVYDDEWLNGCQLPEADLAVVGQPTRVIKGGRSPEWSRATVDEMASLLQNGEVYDLPDHDHLLDPAAVSVVIADFVTSCESGTGRASQVSV